MTARNVKRFKLALVAVLLIVAGISLGVVIQSHISERENLLKQQQLQELYQSGSSGSSSGSSSEQQELPGYANPQFESLLEINPDLAGWLTVGAFSTPVVQTDNNEYYLTHDFYGKEDPHGTVFVDTRSNLAQVEDNIVLYGHNYQKSKQIFYEVERYKRPEYAMENPVLSFTTLTEKRDYLVFGVFLSNTLPAQGEVFDYHNQLRFATVDEMNAFIGEVRKRSLITTDLGVDAGDPLITLSTCGYDFAGERIVLVARQLREDEQADKLGAISYTRSPNPLMPEIWTKLYGKKEPTE